MTDQQTTAELADEAERFKRDYLNACKTIADMHAAATGYVGGPERGVVEDVADVRARMLAAEEALANEQRAEQTEAGRLAADNMLRAVCAVFGGPHQDPIVKARETLARAEKAEAALDRVRDVLNSAYRTMVHDSRDWARDRRDAWLYAILVGWICEDDHAHDDLCMGDEPLIETAQRHGWDEETVTRLRAYRAAIAALGIDGVGQPVTAAEMPIILPADQTTEK